jgi:hypothetical protein
MNKMSNVIEKATKVNSVHVLLAVRRTKENPGQTHKDELCFREIVRGSEEESVARLKARISTMPGVWRIYHTVNARDTRKATKLLMHELLDNFEDQHYRIDSLYKKMLLQTACRTTKYFMLDIDDKAVANGINIQRDLGVNGVARFDSPNGVHWVVEPFNLSKYNVPKSITVIKDGYYFLERVEIK